jgi:hypothetical protein
VGNLMGAMRPKQAKVAAKTCLVLATSIMALCGALILVLRRQLGGVFTSDAAVIKAVVATAPLLAALQVRNKPSLSPPQLASIILSLAMGPLFHTGQHPEQKG